MNRNEDQNHESSSGWTLVESEAELSEKQRKKEKVQERKRRQQQKHEEQRQALIDRETREELTGDHGIYRDSDSSSSGEEMQGNTKDAELDMEEPEEEEYESEFSFGELGPLADAVAGRASLLVSDISTRSTDSSSEQPPHPLYYLHALQYRNLANLFVSRANHKMLLRHSPMLRKVC